MISYFKYLKKVAKIRSGNSLLGSKCFHRKENGKIIPPCCRRAVIDMTIGQRTTIIIRCILRAISLDVPDEPFHHFKALKSVARRSCLKSGNGSSGWRQFYPIDDRLNSRSGSGNNPAKHFAVIVGPQNIPIEFLNNIIFVGRGFSSLLVCKMFGQEC